jgi:hypothetical protein
MTGRAQPEDEVWRPGPRPAWLQSLHAAVDPAWIRLEPDELLEEARRRTGFDDFGGDDAWEEPFRLFVRSAHEEARLHAVGRMLVRGDVRNWLENRLQLRDWRRQHPEIDAERVERPLFIVGLPRTGTSILHELLARDPASRAPLHWEVRYPCPPPEAARYESDPRIERSHRELRLWNHVVPEYDAMHELGGRIPVECIQITAHTFRSDELMGRQQVPSYAAWFAGCDLEPAYRFHRVFLQHLQWRCPGQRWVLKAPSHLGQLSALFAVYPDARVVWIHRDPLKVLPSVASILYSTAWVRSDAVEARTVLEWFTGESCEHLIASAQAFRDAHPRSEQLFDVRHADLLAKPAETLASIYEHFRLPFTAQAERAMRDALAAKSRGKHGVHRYAFEATGHDAVRERERFRAYQERYRVPSEV